MRESAIEILSTKEIPQILVTLAAEHNISVDQSSFIRIEFINPVKVRENMRHIAGDIKDIIITSTNGVQAYAEIFDGQDKMNFYCVGHNTSEKLRQYLPGIKITTAENAISLADEIISYSNSQSFLYFCGDRRRDELPSLLKKSGLSLYEVELYRTVNSPFFVNKNYDGFLFYSPSGVESFYSMNTISSLSTCFAIGDTTADTLRKFHHGEIIVSNRPNAESLIQTTIDYYKHN